MVHYIEKETVKRWFHCDNEDFDAFLSNKYITLRTHATPICTTYHSVDVHQWRMKQKVDNEACTLSLDQLLVWSRFYDKLHDIDTFERFENLKSVFDTLTSLVDISEKECLISIDYMQVLIQWYLEHLSSLFDNYDIKAHQIHLTHHETICLPCLSVVYDEYVLNSFVTSLKQFDFYHALGIIKTHTLYHICRDTPATYAFLKDVVFYLHTVTNTCATLVKDKSYVPIMVNIQPIQQWVKEMIQILFNVTERWGDTDGIRKTDTFKK